ncbi:MAG: hypothetical protein Alpg2KO_29420 [Alphaproteobacteria bacterium]
MKIYLRRRGATVTGYGLVVGLISIVALASVTAVGDRTKGLFNVVGDNLNSVSSGQSAEQPQTCSNASVTLSHQMSVQSVSIPQNCNFVSVILVGAGGAFGNTSGGSGPDAGRGGNGGVVTAVLDLSGVSSMTARIGQAGQRATGSTTIGQGGWPDGGNGGERIPRTNSCWSSNGQSLGLTAGPSAGGGGRSELLLNGAIALIAGAGGGGGSASGEGGDAGGLNGSDGETRNSTGGAGATGSSGGNGGSRGSFFCEGANENGDGTGGTGSSGGDGGYGRTHVGGGGGGGLAGGGGAGGGASTTGGGGGGSSFADSGNAAILQSSLTATAERPDTAGQGGTDAAPTANDGRLVVTFSATLPD